MIGRVRQVNNLYCVEWVAYVNLSGRNGGDARERALSAVRVGHPFDTHSQRLSLSAGPQLIDFRSGSKGEFCTLIVLLKYKTTEFKLVFVTFSYLIFLRQKQRGELK